jgi:hypothetical protein
MRRSLAYPLAPLLHNALESTVTPTDEQLIDLGRAARAVFSTAWTATPRDGRLIRAAIGSVARTFSSDHAGSEALLRRVIVPARLREHGFEELPELAHHLSALISFAPDFCADVYGAAFTHQETSRDQTPMTGGVVLPLTMSRSDAYGGAHYALAQCFAAFLRDQPAAAIRALIEVRIAYANNRSPGHASTGEPVEVDLPTAGRATFIPDHSGIWDQNAIGQEEEVQMLQAFEDRLDELATTAPELALELVSCVLDADAPAAIWRRMFVVGARHPTALSRVLASVVVTLPVLQSLDLQIPAGTYLQAVFASLDQDLRAAAETAILGLVPPGDDRPYTAQWRDALLSSFPRETLVTEAAREIRSALGDHTSADWQTDTWEVTDATPYTNADHMGYEGVDVDRAAYERLHAAIEPVREFATTHHNGAPSIDEAGAIEPALRALQAQVSTHDVDDRQLAEAWDALAAAAFAIARQTNLPAADDVRRLATAIALGAAKHELPIATADNASFDNSPSWGSPAPRVDAAAALLALAIKPSDEREALLLAVDKLTGDPAAVVRFRIAQEIWCLSSQEPDSIWPLVERLRDDPSTAVREALVTSLGRLLQSDTPRALGNLRHIAAAIVEAPGSMRLRLRTLEVLTDVYVWEGDDDACRALDDLITGLPGTAETTRSIVFRLREAMSVGPVDPPDGHLDEARARVLGLVTKLLNAAIDVSKTITDGQPKAMTDWTKEALEQWKQALGVVDHIAREFYFASGAYDASPKNGQSGPRQDPTEAQIRLYHEASAIIDTLVDVGLAQIAHHLLETLEHFIDVAPREVFMRTVRTVRAGQKSGYQYDMLAEGLFVRLVERYLAGHRTLLQQDPECSRSLVEILDIFVRAGWTSARKITYGLDEIYR